MKKLFLFFALLLFIPLFGLNAASTTGFIPGQIWYSEDPLVQGDTVKIYTLVWNGDKDPISFHVEFYDKNTLLGDRDIAVQPERSSDVSISWKVTAGDHIISAKITSSVINSAGKKEEITLERISTDGDHKFVPILVKDAEGNPASGSDVVQSQVGKISSTIVDSIPPAVTVPVANFLGSVDNLRDSIFTSVKNSKEKTKEEINSLDEEAVQPKTEIINLDKALDPKEKVEKPNPLDEPIAYVRLFFLSILGFIFGNKIVFYGILLVLIFTLIRFIYLKIRGN